MQKKAGSGDWEIYADITVIIVFSIGRKAQDWPQLEWPLWSQDGPGRRVLLHHSEPEQGHHMGRGHPVRLLASSQEIYPRHKNGVCWTQKGKRERRYSYYLRPTCSFIPNCPCSPLPFKECMYGYWSSLVLLQASLDLRILIRLQLQDFYFNGIQLSKTMLV